MPAPFWEDLDEFIDEDEFGVSAYFTPLEGGDPFEVVGIFDDAYSNPRLGHDYEMDTQKPSLICKEPDAANIKRYMDCVVKKKTETGTFEIIGEYTVSTVEQEGAGLVRIMMRFEPES